MCRNTNPLINLLFATAMLAGGVSVAADIDPALDNAPADAEPTFDCVINPSVVADLGSGVPGVISELTVDRSDLVNAGDVVARLESGVETAARDLARVRASKENEIVLRRISAEFDRRQLRRAEDLFNRKVISDSDIDERKTNARVAAIEVNRARDNHELAQLELTRAEQVVSRRIIRSPISGVVMERFKTIGEYVDEKPVMRVAQLDPLHVEVYIPVERLGEIQPGMRADVWSDAVPRTRWQAEVSRVDRVADVASATYGARLVLPNPDLAVPAGLRCRLTFLPAQADEPADIAAEQPLPPGDDSGQTPVATADTLPQPPAEAEAAAGTDDTATQTGAMPEDVEPAPAEVMATPEEADEPIVPADDSSDIQLREAAVAPLPEIAAPATEPVCLQSELLDDRKQADALAQQLREAGLDAAVETQRAVERDGFQIVSAPYPTHADARAAADRLDAAGIDDYFLGPDRGKPVRLALGLYRQEAAATRHVDRLQTLGISAQVRPWQHKRIRYLLTISGQADADARALLAGLSMFDNVGANRHCEQLAAR